MMYRALCEFYDLTDGNRRYGAGEDFPRPGLDVSADRLAELSGAGNRLGRPVIEAVEAPARPPGKRRVKKHD